MSDRLPGTSFDNPLRHMGWRIWVCPTGGFDYCHESYKEPPHGTAPADDRYGWAHNIQAAKSAIEQYDLWHVGGGEHRI